MAPGASVVVCSVEPLRLVHDPAPPDALLERRAQARLQVVERSRPAATIASIGTRSASSSMPSMPGRRVPYRGGASCPDVLEDRPDDLRGVLDVDGGAGQQRRDVEGTKATATTQVEEGDHAREPTGGPGPPRGDLAGWPYP